MELGNKISTLRKEAGLSQEQLAEKIGVSRSAIAKWESEKGMPDIENIVVLSEVFNKTTDYFLKDEKSAGIVADSALTEAQGCATSIQEYAGKTCNITLDGWNDGAYDAVIVGEDDRFVFYRVNDKKNEKYGAIAKAHIVNIEVSKKKAMVFTAISREYFVGKHVKLELAKEKGLIKSFFDFKDDDYMDVVITSFENEVVNLEWGRNVEQGILTKIEEC